MNHATSHRNQQHIEKTSLLAYQLWQQANCPPGEDVKFWLQAEQLLSANRDQQPVTNPKVTGPTKSAIKRAATPLGHGSTKSQPANTKKPVGNAKSVVKRAATPASNGTTKSQPANTKKPVGNTKSVVKRAATPTSNGSPKSQPANTKRTTREQ